MNFLNFYHSTQRRLKDSVISLWATGDEEMKTYFSKILDDEKLMAEPIFQTAFPWEPSNKTFETVNNIFNDSFINAMDSTRDEAYRFSKQRIPYKHQIESWDVLINREQSIAVTTGTGSGKTECFMLPVLYDIYKNCRNSNGVNAIFLYPLNALIGSQKKRVDAWCRALGGISYAVYNGKTKETAQSRIAAERLPELISREQIRETPPQILFTNPSMLEYILVRNKDVTLLEKSAGTLRWILLDEAHTLTGSSAAEMALLIRRLIDAFGVNVSQLRFAITSATVGNDGESEVRLKSFMAKLCGISEENIKVITGKRVFPQQLPEPIRDVFRASDVLGHANPEQFKAVKELRQKLLEQPAISATEVGKLFKTADLDEQVKILDYLSEREVEGESLLPVRAHFFSRGIGGVFACTNPTCGKHRTVLPSMAAGTMTTLAGRRCECGWLMLELVSCQECGKQLLEGERLIAKSNGEEQVRMASVITRDHFDIENTDEEEEGDTVRTINSKFYFSRNVSSEVYSSDATSFSLSEDGVIIREQVLFKELDNGTSCPHCHTQITRPFHFRLSSSFINRILSDIFLEETPQAEVQTKEMLWNGHKYISFTDSRQGTAKITALINQDTEAKWVRSQIYHKLWEKNIELLKNTPKETKEELEAAIDYLEKDLESTSIPIIRRDKLRQLNDYRAKLAQASPPFAPETMSWQEIKTYLRTLTDFNILYQGNNPHDGAHGARDHYLTAILYDQFARRIPRQNSLENLGLVSLVYPKFQLAHAPNFGGRFSLSDDEWRSLLKISADFVIRYNFHMFVDWSIAPYTTRVIRSQAIYDKNALEVDVKRWRGFDRSYPMQHRLALLVCAGLGFHDRDAIDASSEDAINEIMEALWSHLKIHILSRDSKAFKLSLEEVTRFGLTQNAWLCPVRKRLLDVHFRGYSPWIKGQLSPDNIDRYKIKKAIQIPSFPFPFSLDSEKTPQIQPTLDWIKENTGVLQEQGVWSNIHEQVILNRPVFLSGEHSAQQDENRLAELENQFEVGKINILNCSTTMEMGVDIGGISTVVMNNVPPRPANYLQRAGRAGRRREAQSLAFTICAPNPIGMNAIENPKWALAHKIAPPFLSFQSEPIVERHVNAFFLGKYIQTSPVKGISIRITTQTFFLIEGESIAKGFSSWLFGNGPLQCQETLKTITRDTPLAEKSFAYILNNVIRHFQDLSEQTLWKMSGFQESLKRLSTDFGLDSPAYKSVLYQQNQFLNKNAIGYMAESGFLPSAGLPTGIVEFDTLNVGDLAKKNIVKSKPSYFITRALSEFAPGKEVVIDGRCYVSKGIVLENEMGNRAEREIVQSCKHCGYQRIADIASEKEVNSMCPHCGHNSFKGLNFIDPTLNGMSYTEMIQPAGFATDLYELPTRKISENSFTEYIDPLLINVTPWQNESTTLFDVRGSEGNAEILFYNMGNGNGYSICLHCGRAASDRLTLSDHKRLRGGKSKENDKNALCSGNDSAHAIHDNVILGGRFKTDFSEIRFKDDSNQFTKNISLLYTLGVVLSKELSHYLGVEEGEIDFGIKRYDTYSTVFIFDTVKGGAGYASQFSLHAGEIFASARHKLGHCNCSTACTKCLIDRNTQWHIDKLDKNVALAWLNRVTNTSVPSQLSTIYADLKTVTGGIKDEIGRLIYAGKITKFRLYGSSNVRKWTFENMQFVDRLKGRVPIDLVLNSDQIIFDLQDKISIIQAQSWSTIWTLPKTDITPLQTICKVETDDGVTVEYLAENFEQFFDSNWGNSNAGVIYKRQSAKFESLKGFEIKITESSMCEAIIDQQEPILSIQIADLLIEGIGRKLNLKSFMNRQSFQVTYYDRYLRTPLGCLLMFQFVERLGFLLGFSIKSFAFNGQDFTEEKDPYLIYHSFRTGNDRNNAITQLSSQFNMPTITAIDNDLPHYRYFEFQNEHLKIIIRPDAGIEHGWFCSHTNRRDHLLFSNFTNTNSNISIVKKANSGILYTISVNDRAKI